ncbi:hypothetical protein NECAME_08701 [Necator americanus]|uniref:Chloride transporter, ClC family n=1 Tax=Necator americanus TaxID=51031 RepID=W2TIY1_NECAM|nr:hypothetical protein NECAME_08701 [Necator americanus]ETN81116.1 hypothetical protein NECAME_08701 [Necator americanus]
MKTIIRGVVLRDYLTFPTLVSKVFGVALSLGSSVPIGKMGSFVHIASVVANQLSLLGSKFDSAFGSETRKSECLAAACAVGVACTFSAPVGVTPNNLKNKLLITGVLFPIEVTTMYFSVFLYRLSAKPYELGREFLVPCGSCCFTLAYQLKSFKRKASLGGFKTLSLLRAVKVFNEPVVFLVDVVHCGIFPKAG